MFYSMEGRQFRDIWRLNMVGLWRIVTVDGSGQRWGCVWRVGVKVEVVRAVARVKLDLLSCFWATFHRDATARFTIAHHTSASSSYLHDISPKNFDYIRKFSTNGSLEVCRVIAGEISCVFGIEVGKFGLIVCRVSFPSEIVLNCWWSGARYFLEVKGNSSDVRRVGAWSYIRLKNNNFPSSAVVAVSLEYTLSY